MMMIVMMIAGYLSGIDSLVCAEVCKELGAGRTIAGQKLDMTVGLEIKRNVGDNIKKGLQSQLYLCFLLTGMLLMTTTGTPFALSLSLATS